MLNSSRRRHWFWLAVLFVASLFVVPMSAQATAPRASMAASGTVQLVPVWAFLNGVAPVAGGRVQIIAGGRPVRLLNGATSALTDANGVVVLSARRVPSRFRVVVQGGGPPISS